MYLVSIKTLGRIHASRVTVCGGGGVADTIERSGLVGAVEDFQNMCVPLDWKSLVRVVSLS